MHTVWAIAVICCFVLNGACFANAAHKAWTFPVRAHKRASSVLEDILEHVHGLEAFQRARKQSNASLIFDVGFNNGTRGQGVVAVASFSKVPSIPAQSRLPCVSALQLPMPISRPCPSLQFCWSRSGGVIFPVLPSLHSKLCFTGGDTGLLLGQGHDVVAVDANPLLIAAGKERFASEIAAGRLLLVAAALGEEAAEDVTFYVAGEQSSLDKAKACHWDVNCEEISVPVFPCEALFQFGHPLYLKIDIEERHYVCVLAVQSLPTRALPMYVSWEMHEFQREKRLPYPLMDNLLLLELYQLGYGQVKIVDQTTMRSEEGHTMSSTGGLPDTEQNVVANSADWMDLANLIRQGIPGRKNVDADGAWYDFHVKLGNVRNAAAISH